MTREKILAMRKALPSNRPQYQGGSAVAETPIDILSRRLASGEISIEEFARLKEALSDLPVKAPELPESAHVVEKSEAFSTSNTLVPADSPPETEAERMLRRAREWKEQQQAGGSPALALSGVVSPDGPVSVQQPSGVQQAGFKPWMIGAGAGAVGLVFLAAVGGGNACEVSNVSSRAEMLYIDGLDYGVIVTATVRNTGSDGTMNLDATLSTSEGTYQRARQTLLSADQSRQVEFQFDEPTINVNENDLQAVVNCTSS